jgi:hypothetical protein
MAWQSPSKIPFARPNPPHMSETYVRALPRMPTHWQRTPLARLNRG